MAKQHRGSKPRPVIGTHHGLMHGSQSHQQLFYRSARLGSNSSTNTSPKGSARSSFSKYTANRNSFNLANVSLNSPKNSTSSNSSSLMDRGTYKVQRFRYQSIFVCVNITNCFKSINNLFNILIFISSSTCILLSRHQHLHRLKSSQLFQNLIQIVSKDITLFHTQQHPVEADQSIKPIPTLKVWFVV